MIEIIEKSRKILTYNYVYAIISLMIISKWGINGAAVSGGSVIGNFVYNLSEPRTAIANYLGGLDG